MLDQVQVAFCWVTFGILLFYLIPTLLVLKYRKSSELIRRRNPFLMVFSSITGAGCSIICLAGTDIFSESIGYTCIMRIVTTILLYPPFLLTYLMRACHLVCLDTIQRNSVAAKTSDGPVALNFLQRLAFLLQPNNKFERNSAQAKRQTSIWQSPYFQMLRWILRYYVLAALIIFLMTEVHYSAKVSLYSPTCYVILLWPLTGVRVGITGLCLAMLFQIRNIHDQLNIRDELLASMSAFSIGLLLYIIEQYSQLFSLLGPTLWTGVACILCHIITVVIPVCQVAMSASSSGNGKDKSSSISQRANNEDMLYFLQVLGDPALYEQLKSMMLQEFCIENALFLERYEAIVNLVEEYSGNPISTNPALHLFQQRGSNEAKKTMSINNDNMSSKSLNPAKRSQISQSIHEIYLDFIQVHSVHELNLSADRRRNFELALQQAERDNSPLDLQILQPIAIDVYRLIYCNTFQRFLRLSRKRNTLGVRRISNVK